jgi:hypothetical protein
MRLARKLSLIMANILLIMFNKPLSQKIVRELEADGHRVDAVVGILQLSTIDMRAIAVDQRSERRLDPQDFDLAIVCTSSRHAGNYLPGEVASWLHNKQVPCICLYAEGEELEVRLANPLFGIERSEQLCRDLIYGERSVSAALKAKSDIAWMNMPPIPDDPKFSIFHWVRDTH